MKRSRKGLYLTLALLGLVAGLGYYVATSQTFERTPPTIRVAKEIYWNLKEPIAITIEDDTALDSYQVAISNGKEQKVLEGGKLQKPTKELTLRIDPPAMEFPQRRAWLLIQARDKSLWNYFLGNERQVQVPIIIDTKKPDLFVVTNSYSITKGGSALVIFHCKDDHLHRFFVQTNFATFQAAPFYKDGYYIALIAWPITQERFKADLIAIDRAGNRAKAHIPFYLRNRRYKTSKIELTDAFLNGKVAELAENYPKTRNMDPIERFKFVNETLRKINEEQIHTIGKRVPQERVDHFSIRPFYPLRNGAKVADFGDHRFYYYKGKLVSEAYHMGLDLASTKMAKIKATNGGEVVFADDNGIYGNMPMISHGLGLYTLYAHCSTLFVHEGDRVEDGATIAKTGSTGLALGDHLHFGVVVQGIEVRPEEWMDGRWIRLNITNVIEDAKKLIDSK
ncbi:MAG: peptidase M23 [Nitratiruptor sp.]|nr:peptidase M23 [Nitratiruptor sp.]NPA82861.1 M23 family metallopeptidase [Campylobacterota bacterium]